MRGGGAGGDLSIWSRAGEVELFERSMALEKLSREELVLPTLDALESALAGRLAAGGEPRRLIRAVDLVRQLRAAAQLNANPGQLAGWLCAGMFS